MIRGLSYFLIAVVLFAGCSGSPTAPTATPVTVITPPAVVVTPPVTVTPPVVTPPVSTPNPLLSDPRFSLSFYRMFALGETPDGSFTLLRRQTQAPRIYLRTVDDAGRAIDAYTLNETAAALINTAGKLTGVFGLAGLERGTDTREGRSGWITVRWAVGTIGSLCGTANMIAGDLITLYGQNSRCRCSGGPQVNQSTVRHELGHALGFHHTDSRDDLMFPTITACDKEPSAREVFHAQVAYSQPNGSLNPR